VSKKNKNYNEKFEVISQQTIYSLLKEENQNFIKQIAFKYRFTLSELRIICEISKDLQMWMKNPIEHYWNIIQIENKIYENDKSNQNIKQLKKQIFVSLQKEYEQLENEEKTYDLEVSQKPIQKRLELKLKDTSAQIFGYCPVASEKTVCCNLRTIDAVNNCGMGCSYCCIQTFFSKNEILFDSKLKEKLDAIELDEDRFYHIGTGQSSDSLMWGNKFNLLDDLLNFAQSRKNIWLEFKTKSVKVDYFLKRKTIPDNISCSWSLNTESIINNEEHFTASLDKRIVAAQKVVEKGIKVGFHLHPIVHYKNWEQDYKSMIDKILDSFNSEDILFISLGTLTFAKPIVKEIRTLDYPSKILQMPFSKNPEGKLTYTDEIKFELFDFVHQAFSPWHDKVYFYFCMEEEKFWKHTFGFVYHNNEEFEDDFAKNVQMKLEKKL